jgi:hypothetical protein
MTGNQGQIRIQYDGFEFHHACAGMGNWVYMDETGETLASLAPEGS